MIRKVRLVNFYSFKDETIEFHPETNMLIGINGSGKSNLLKAFQLLIHGVNGNLDRHVTNELGGVNSIVNIASKSSSKTPLFKIEFSFNLPKLNVIFGKKQDDLLVYSVAFHSNLNSGYFVEDDLRYLNNPVLFEFIAGRGEVKDASLVKKDDYYKYEDFDPCELAISNISDSNRFMGLVNFRSALKEISVFFNFDTTPYSKMRRPMLPTSEKRLLPDGANLPQILNTININNKSNFRKIVQYLGEVNPQFTNIDFNFIGGNIELMLEEKGLESSIHVSNISDGTLRYLCLLAILFNPNRGFFICIDEPEVGLHPDMLYNIAKAIKEVASETTICISTHSPLLLNYFLLENIRVFDKNDENATIVKSLNEDDYKGWYESFTPGLMWQQGDFGGVRYGS
jgi:predicted ATPase